MKGKRELVKNLKVEVLGLVIALLLLSVPAFAQENNAQGQQDNRTTTTRTETRRDDNKQPERDWGWLGLLGLGGLLGLMPRKRVPVVHQVSEQREVRPGMPAAERR